MRAVIVGAVESTEIAIAAFARSDWELTLIVTLPVDKSARHSDYVDLQQVADIADAQVHRTTQTNHPDTLAAIATAKPDYIFVIGWSQICGPDFLNLVPGKVIGYHPAALPRLRGRAALAWTIILDEKVTAGSLFWMDDGVDTGAILEQQFFHVAPRETAATLYAKHMTALGTMIDRALPRLASGLAEPQAQDESCATYATRRTAADGLIDWNIPATKIDRLVRAAGKPYPGAFTTAKGSKFVIWETEIYNGDAVYHATPGQLVGTDGERLVVQTGNGLLVILNGHGSMKANLPCTVSLGAAMDSLAYLGKVLVIAPHPDDEILGCGGTMARLLAEGGHVGVAIVTKGQQPQFPAEMVEGIRAETKAAHSLLGVTQTHYLDLPAAALDRLPATELNATLAKLVQDAQPDTLFLPFVGDIHTDHQLTFLAAMVAARPRHAHAPRRIYAYETLSETNWYAPGITPAFVPNVFIDISETLERKLDAFRCFESQVREFPDERSIEAIRALAVMRGASMYRKAAEAFMLIRQID